MAVEGTFRDWHHGWGLREAVTRLRTEIAVCRLVGIVSLAFWLQVELGWRVSLDAVGRKRRAQWTATDRVSMFWCGQRIFDDPGYDWADWLSAQWEHPIVPDGPTSTLKLTA